MTKIKFKCKLFALFQKKIGVSSSKLAAKLFNDAFQERKIGSF